MKGNHCCRYLAGQRFGRLSALSAWRRGRDIAWRCKCDCGAETFVITERLQSGETRSCGCLARELLRTRKTTHGMSKSDEHRCWRGMKKRCLNENFRFYYRYGGRDITICDRWLHSFENFFADMGVRPSKLHSIDRIDNNGNYEPSNCRWVTQEQQCQNKSSNKLTPAIVREIRNIGEGTNSNQLARRFGVTHKAIRNVREYKSWRSVV